MAHQMKKKDSSEIETIKEVLLNICRILRQIQDKQSDHARRLDDFMMWLTNASKLNRQLLQEIVDNRPRKNGSWLPKNKKEITTVVALVVFALTVLAIILASCGVISCSEIKSI